MIKVTGTIIDKEAKLTGLVFEGDYADFGENGTGKVSKFVPMQYAVQLVNKSSNFAFNGTRLVSKKDTKKNNGLQSLQMYTTSNVPVDNQMKLTKRHIRNDEVVGYTVEFSCGIKGSFSIVDIIQFSTYFKPANFYVKRHTRTGKHYLVGTAGNSLDNLPQDILFSKNKHAKKHTQDTGVIKGQTDVHKAQTVGQLDVDVVNLFTILKETGAYVTTLKGTSYERTTAAVSQTGDDFIPLGSSRIAKANIAHSEDLMKVTLPFKLPGTVNVPGFSRPVFTYTYKDMAIFKNNKNHMENLGVAIPSDSVNLLMVFLQKAKGLIKIKTLEDAELKQTMASLMGKPITQLTFLELNLQGMKLLSDETVAKSMLSTEDLAKLINKFESDKFIVKAIKYKIKELKSVVGNVKKPLPEYAGYSQELQDALTNAGIDIYDGSYKRTVAYKKKSADDKSDTIVDDTLSISYTVCPVKGTGEVIWCKGTKGLSPYIETTIQKLKALESTLSPEDYMKELIKIQKEYEKVSESVKHVLWLHKMAMLQASDLKTIHQHDKAAWTEVLTKKVGKVRYAASTSLGVLTVDMSDSITI